MINGSSHWKLIDLTGSDGGCFGAQEERPTHGPVPHPTVAVFGETPQVS